jgi:hypothetical protein
LNFHETGNPKLLRVSHDLGIRLMGNRVRSFYRVLDTRRFAEAWFTGRDVRAPRPLLRAGLAALRGWGALRGRTRRATLPSGAALRTVTRFDERFDRFFERAAAPFDFIAERNAEFLQWRFGDRRAGPFVVRVLEDGAGEPLGYVVARVTARRAHVADLLAVPDQPEVVETLLAQAVHLSRQAGAGGIACWLPDHHPYRNSLRRLGFVPRRRDVGMRYRARALPAEELAFLDRADARTHIMMGDTDQV